MEKGFKALLAVALIVFAAACGASENKPANAEPTVAATSEPTNAPATEQPSAQPTESASLSDIGAVFAEAYASSQAIESMAADIQIKSEFVDQGATMTTKSSIYMEMTMKPLAFSQRLKTEVAGQSMNIEMYSVNDELYMKNEMLGTSTWMKYPAELSELADLGSIDNMNPAQELQKLQDYAEQGNVVEEGNTYVITFSFNGDSYSELLQELGSQLELDNAELQALSSDVTINQMDFKYVLDKKTKYPIHMTTESRMIIDVNGTKQEVYQLMTAEYSKINEIGEITLPAEAANAQSITDLMPAP